MLHKWMPRSLLAEDHALLAQPACLQGNRSGIFAGRVCLVEDCDVTLLASKLLLQQQGLYIDTAVSGEAAMAMLCRREYDLLLLDINLPGISVRRPRPNAPEHGRSRPHPPCVTRVAGVRSLLVVQGHVPHRGLHRRLRRRDHRRP